MQYYSLQHRTSLQSPGTSITGYCFSSFFLKLFLHSSPVAYWAPTYLGGGVGFIFQCHIFLPFHTVHGDLKARILKWFAILFSSGPHFVRTLHNDPSVLDVLVIIGDWNVKVESQEIPGVTGKFGLGEQNEVGQRLTQFCQWNALAIANTHFQ